MKDIDYFNVQKMKYLFEKVSYKPNKVIVTGGAGFIGSHLVDLLIAKNYKVVVLDNFISGNKENLKNMKKILKL